MTTLILLRHAKAAAADGAGDHHRPLAEAGRRQAALAAAELKRLGVKPDIVLVSSALRTRQTYDIIAAAQTGWPPATFEDDLYLASTQVLTRRLKKIPPRTKSLLVIGHNPGLADLTCKLADPVESDPAAVEKSHAKFPPASCAVLTVLTPWSEMQDADCGLSRFFTPADLGGADEE